LFYQVKRVAILFDCCYSLHQKFCGESIVLNLLCTPQKGKRFTQRGNWH